MFKPFISITRRHGELIGVIAVAAAILIAVISLFAGCDNPLEDITGGSPNQDEVGRVLERRSAHAGPGTAAPGTPARKSLKPHRSRYGRIYASRNTGENVLVMGPEIRSIESKTKPWRNADGSITIPAAITCILIDRVVFSHRAQLRTIGQCAFCDHRIRSVKVPEGVVDIGPYAFAHNSMETLRFPGSLKTIGHYAFAHNKLRAISIPRGVTQIGPHAFKENETLNVTVALESLVDTPASAFHPTARLRDYNGRRIRFDGGQWTIEEQPGA